MTVLGLVPIALSAYLLLRLYLKYLRERSRGCFAFLELIEAVERGLSHSLKTPAECVADCSDPFFSEVGFSELVADGETLYSALQSCGGRITLPSDAQRLLCELFSLLGSGYLDGELNRLRDARAELKCIAEREQGKIIERGRVAGAVIFAATSGLALLIV